MLPPESTLVGAVLVMDTLALSGLTVVLALLLLLVLTGSPVALLTVAVLLTLVAVITLGAVTAMLALRLPALARLAWVQVTVRVVVL